MGLETLTRDVERRQRRNKARSLYWLATEILGYDKLSPTFHGPMLAKWDEIDRKRLKGASIDTLDLWSRDHIKTWAERARVIRYFIFDPTITVTWWHAVEEMAQESAVAIGRMLQTCKPLRELFDLGILPSPMAKRFVGASGFSLRSNRIGDAPSLRAWGAGSEATGGHSRVGVLDDPVGWNDVSDSQMPAKKRWYQATVRNVVRADGWIDVIGTRWPEDIYGEWLKSPHWVSTVRAALETDGKPDYKGEPVYLTKAQVKRKRDEMGEYMFAFQMMNDDTAKGERPWVAEKMERRCTLKDLLPGAFKIVLSDPAPYEPGRSSDGATKDDWATLTIGLQSRGQRREIIWLDGAFSPSWTPSEGFEEICRQKRRWKTGHVAIERVAQTIQFYMKDLEEISRREGVKHREHELTLSHQGKNAYFRRLCDRAAQGELLICESVPDAVVEKTLDQCRRWLPLPTGRNSLKHDDLANCLSFATDPSFRHFAPEADEPEWSPYLRQERDEEFGGSRYIKW